MQKLLMLFLVIGPGSPAFSQLRTAEGMVRDTGENRPLAYAVISFIRPTDSILLGFTRSDGNGRFLFKKLPASGFQMLVTYPGYADYTDIVQPKDSQTFSLGIIPMIRRAELLEQVIVRQQVSAIRIKGDTTEFVADSFATRPGANVEELLKRLPGIQVNSKGEITAQGQQVKKILVDGEEFFSDDPAVVTQNLPADAVKEVQLYDKKSDQAEFTGIDDGDRAKTINLKLKPDRKKGYFGKSAISGGTNERFDNNAMLNSFKGSRKLSGFFIMSNTGKAGLDWQDQEKFGGGNNVEMNEEDGFFYYQDPDAEFNQSIWLDQGLPSTWTGGLHFSNKWNGDRSKINGNYRYFKRNVFAEGSTISRFILPDTQYFNSNNNRNLSSRIRNNMVGTYEAKLDSLSSLKINFNGGLTEAQGSSLFEGESRNADSALVNTNRRQLVSDTKTNDFNATVLWRKKFNVTGRTLSITAGTVAKRQTLAGFLNSDIDYYNDQGMVDRQELIDQRKHSSTDKLTMNTNVVYTEPILKKTFLSLNYGYRFSRENSLRNTFDKGTASSDYDDLNSLLSNDFIFRHKAHIAGADIKVNTKKIVYQLGSSASYSVFDQTDLVRDTARKYSFLNFFPKASFVYTMRPQRRLNITYNGSTNPPQVSQVQPVRENTDPLNIQIGNPSLRQEFNHTVGINFQDFKILTQRHIWVGAHSTLSSNAISTASTVDAGGKTTTQFINVTGNFRTSLNGNFNIGLKKSHMHISFGPSLHYNRASNRLNGLMNVNDNQSYKITAGLYKYSDKKYGFQFSPSLSYVSSKSSLRPDIVTEYFMSETYGNAWAILPWKLEINSSVSVNLRQKTDVFDVNRNVVKWDAFLARKFLKNDKAELRMDIYDILDQNIGFQRYASSNVISQNSYSTFRRYAMLSFILNISKTPTP